MTNQIQWHELEKKTSIKLKTCREATVSSTTWPLSSAWLSHSLRIGTTYSSDRNPSQRFRLCLTRLTNKMKSSFLSFFQLLQEKNEWRPYKDRSSLDSTLRELGFFLKSTHLEKKGKKVIDPGNKGVFSVIAKTQRSVTFFQALDTDSKR